MQLESSIVSLSSAVYHAAHVAFSDLHYVTRDWEKWSKMTPEAQKQARSSGQEPSIARTRRPTPDECQVMAMFSQTWGSTALGFGGIGGAAMTPAYTVVVRSPSGEMAVYWRGSFAYLIPVEGLTDEQKKAFLDDIQKCRTHSRREAVERYGAVISGVDEGNEY